MANNQNPGLYNSGRPPGPFPGVQNSSGPGHGALPGNNFGMRPEGQWKPPAQPPMPGFPPSGNPASSSPQKPGVNGVSTPPPLTPGQPSGSQPPVPISSVTGPTGPVMNGPNPVPSPNFSGNQFPPGPPRPRMPPTMPQGQARPQGPPFGGPPSSFPPSMPPSSMAPRSFGPPQMQGMPRIGMMPPPPSTSVSQDSSMAGTPPPPVTAPTAPGQAERPNELPVPYQGQGQYTRQVGMQLTPGITPINSAPPSQKSSRNSSPTGLGASQNFDALEGQFRGTPEQELNNSFTAQTPGTPNTGTPQQGTPHMDMAPASSPQPWGAHQGGHSNFQPPSGSQPGATPPTVNQSNFGPPQPNQPRFPPHSSGGQPSGFPPSVGQQPRGPAPTAVIPPQRMAPPPSSVNQHSSLPHPPSSTSQQPGFPPPQFSVNQQTGITAPGSSASQQPRFPLPPTQANQQPAFQPHVPSSANQRPGFPQSPATPVQRPGFPPPQPQANQQPGFPPGSMANQQPGFPPAPGANQQSGFPPAPLANQQPGFPPAPGANQQSGFPPAPLANQQPGFPPAPVANQHQGFPPAPLANQQPGFPPAPGANQQPGFPPPPSSNQQPGFPPAPVTNQQHPAPGANQRPGFPPTSNLQPGFPPQPAGQHPGQGQGRFPAPGQQFNQGPAGHGGQQPFTNAYQRDANSLSAGMGNMNIQEGLQMVNLLQQKKIVPPDGLKPVKPKLSQEFKKVNCNPDVFRCTLSAIPQTSSLLNKARLPLGILIHPFRDLSQLPVIQSSVIVRCRSCRTYINPFVMFIEQRRWKCNLCYRINDLPEEFSYDPVSKTYGDPQRRPEIRSATIEFIAPSEYMLRPPQPAVYLYLLDVSFNALETGYLTVFCQTLLDVLDKVPGDSRTQIGFIAYDSAVHFFNLAEGLSQPQMLTVSDVDDIFLPCPDNLLVNLTESKELVIDLLNQLPTLFEGTMETGSALGAALQAAYKLTSSNGGRVTVMQTILPTVGPGALQNREDATLKASKEVPNLGPAIDFYKKLALDCSAQQIAVDLFMLNGSYADMASVECISKFSGGCVHYYPSFHSVRAPHMSEKFEVDLRRYLTRKIGFEAVMRIRCSKGLSIHTFHGNFFVRSTDLLSLPNINPDAGFGMQMSIEESLTDMSTMCFQAALLYTSSKGERRIRVHTLCLPVTNQLSEIYASADQQAIVSLLAKMAVDRSTSSSMSDAREAIVNAAIDGLNAYGATLNASQRMGSLPVCDSLRLLPLYCLALLKSTAFRINIPTNLDDRVYALQQFKTLPTGYLVQQLYPSLYPVHTIMDVELVSKSNLEVPNLPLLQLSSANIDRFGAYLLDTGTTLYLYICSGISEQFCQDVLDKPNFQAIQEGGMTDLPELENPGSERLRNFMTYLLDSRPNGAAFIIAREDGKNRTQFFHHFVEDRSESALSYYEFLQQIQKQMKS